MSLHKLAAPVGTLAPLAMGSIAGSVRATPTAKTDLIGPVEVSSAVYSDVSRAVRDLTGVAPAAGTDKEKKEKSLRVLPNMGNALDQTDGALQTSAGPLAGTTNGLNFAGFGQRDYGFADQYAPPDTVGGVGATQYVQWVNTYFAVFNKTTGAIAAGFPKPGNSVWAGFGGGCQTNNDGRLSLLWVVFRPPLEAKNDPQSSKSDRQAKVLVGSCCPHWGATRTYNLYHSGTARAGVGTRQCSPSTPANPIASSTRNSAL